MNRKSIIENYLWQASYNVLLIILPIITMPIVSRALGPDGVGQYNYVNSIVNYFVLLGGLGLNIYGIREIALVRKDSFELSRKFWEIQSLNVILSLGALSVYLILCTFMNSFLLFLVQSLVVVGCIFDITWFFTGLEEFKKISIRNFIIKFISFFITIFFIRDKSDIVAFFLIQSLSVLCSQLSLWAYIGKKVEFIRPKKARILGHLRLSLVYFLPKLSTTIYINGVKTILGFLGSMAAVGLFSNALSLLAISSSILSTLNTVLIPNLSNLFEDDKKEFELLVTKATQIQLFFSIAIMFGFIAIANDFVYWFFGNGFSSLAVVIPALSPMVVFQNFQAAIGNQYFVPQNKMRPYNRSTIGGAVIAVLFSFLLIPSLGIYGGVIAIVMCYAYISLRMYAFLKKNTAIRLDFRNIIIWIFCGGVMTLSIKLLGTLSSIPQINSFLQVLVGGGIYLIMTMLFKRNPIFNFLTNRKMK